MMDFDKFLENQGSALPVEPRELHEQLPNKVPGYGYLRDVQAQVLTAWHARREERDLVIKVNTGGGKTIDGLIILQSCLNEGQGPALYVAPDNYLVKQVLKEASNLGIATVTNPDDPRYLASEAIAVVNASKLFNGRTVFSDDRTPAAPVPIGTVVIDDAHAAIATLRQKLSLTIGRPMKGAAVTADTDSMFEELLDLFREDLHQQYPDGILDVIERSPGALVRVPFWSWRGKVEEARTVLRAHTKSGQKLYYPWPAVSRVLHLCRVVFTSKEVTITPPCPPIAHVSGFACAKRRVYLSATMADDSVLVTDFGADPESIRSPINPLTAGDIGERMIIAPQDINASIGNDEIRKEIVKLSAEYNTVVLVPSNAAMAAWPEADRTASADDIEDVVNELKSGVHVGLVVLSNKYDGIDLPQDACRILVIDGLPTAFTGEERLESQLTSQEFGVDDRQVQRIEQGMGRGVRSNEDHCVVILIGPRLSQLTSDPRTLPRFSPATRAQLKLSRDVARSMDEMPISAIIGTIKQGLERDNSWVTVAKRSLRGIAPEPGRVSPIAVSRRQAFEAAIMSDYPVAAGLIEKAVEASEVVKEQGWLLEQQAAYVDHFDPSGAQTLLALARTKNGHATRPVSGVSYTKLSGADKQATKASANLVGMYGNPAALRLGVESILEDLRFDPLKTGEFEAAMLMLGHVIGLGSQRPEQELGQGPDNLWALGDNKFWVIEAKTGAVSKFIAKRDVGQLGQSMAWFAKRYDESAVATPVMVHLETQLFKDATAPYGMRVLTARNLGRLITAVRSYSEALASLLVWNNPADIERLLEGHKLRADDLSNYLVMAKES
jgi:hypothetical protein